MDALVMCGGRGTRLDAPVEKPLFEIRGVPMVACVLQALRESRVEAVRVVTSPQAPNTRAFLRRRDCDVVDAPGEGYVADLSYALDRVDPPVLTVAADVPLLDAEAVNDVIDRTTARSGESLPSLTVAVPRSLKRRLGVSVDTTTTVDGECVAPSGVNVVAGEEQTWFVVDDVRFAVNVNRRADARVASDLLAGEAEEVSVDAP